MIQQQVTIKSAQRRKLARDRSCVGGMSEQLIEESAHVFPASIRQPAAIFLQMIGELH